VEASYNILIDRALDIGAKDMLEGDPQPAATPAPAAARVAAAAVTLDLDELLKARRGLPLRPILNR
jgi:hypothetical protein